jgi:cytochrome c-type biogenesis protein CcmH
VTPEPLPPSAAGLEGLTPEQRAAVEAMTPEDRQAMVRDMVDQLAARLQEEPDDLEGWAKLVRARTVLGEQAAAQETLDRALEIFADAPFPRQRLIDLAGELGLVAPEAGGGAPDIGAMVERLAARLKDEPGDLEGWRMLARSYLVLERHAEAREAIARALALAPDDLEILTLQARAIRAAAGDAQTTESIAVMRRVLELAPNNLEALWFVGQAEADAGNTGRARELLERAYALIPEDSPDRATLRQRIDEITGG